jgi:alkaline phosphatase
MPMAYKISNEDAKEIFGYYHGLEKREDGLYNYKKLPFKLLSDIQKEVYQCRLDW